MASVRIHAVFVSTGPNWVEAAQIRLPALEISVNLAAISLNYHMLSYGASLFATLPLASTP